MPRKSVSLALLLASALAFPLTAAAKSFVLYGGSYTAGPSKGVYAWRFDSDTGAMTPLGLAAETPQAAHVWISPNGKFLYTVNWEQKGGVSAYRIDPKTAKLTFLNRVSSGGVNPNQIVLDPTGRLAVTVNYGSGTLSVFKVLPDGRLSEAFYTEQYSGAPRSKMTGPHTHGIQFSKDGKVMWIAELGLDRIYAYHVDAAKARITPVEPPYIETHAGAGPRRLQLSPTGKFLYVNHETDAEVSVFAVDGAKLTEIQAISTLPPEFSGANMTSEIVIDAAGRHLYVANRGHDSIAVFDIDPASGKLTRTANVASGGKTPRNLRIDPTGQYLLSANENGGAITVLKIDKATGGLTLTGQSAQIDTPGGMYFLNADIPAAHASQVVWKFDNLKTIGGYKVEAEGSPKLVAGPAGKAVQFAGKDSLFIDGRPLVGAQTFTIEAIVRPEGGPFQQRFMHVAETDPKTGLDALPSGTADPNPRFMFEVRVKDGQWALDAFVNSKAGNKPLLFMDKLHPLNRWYVVTQTYDGRTYRAYVDGVLQGEGEVAFTPHGPGHVRVGARMNHVDYFTGSVAEARFTDRALQPSEFLKIRQQGGAAQPKQ